MRKAATNTGKELERRVADAYRRMGARKIEHDVPLAGNQIDVYVELEAPDRSLHRIAVEVKDWAKPVGVDVVNGFAQIVGLLHRERLIDRGVIVSGSGFSRPARDAAETYDIRLLELGDLEATVAAAAQVSSRIQVCPATRSDSGGVLVKPWTATVAIAELIVAPEREARLRLVSSVTPLRVVIVIQHCVL